MEIVRGLIHSNVKPVGQELGQNLVGGEAALDRADHQLFFFVVGRQVAVLQPRLLRECLQGLRQRQLAECRCRTAARFPRERQSRPAERNADEHAGKECPCRRPIRVAVHARPQAEPGSATWLAAVRCAAVPGDSRTSEPPVVCLHRGGKGHRIVRHRTRRASAARRRIIDDDLGRVVAVEPARPRADCVRHP